MSDWWIRVTLNESTPHYMVGGLSSSFLVVLLFSPIMFGAAG